MNMNIWTPTRSTPDPLSGEMNDRLMRKAIIKKLGGIFGPVGAVLLSLLSMPNVLADVSGSPMSPPYSIDVEVQTRIWEVGKVIPLSAICRVQNGDAARVAVTVEPWVKVVPESASGNIEVVLSKTALAAGESAHVTIPGTISLKANGEFTVLFTIADETGTVRNQQRLFVVSRDGRVAVTGSDFEICEWHFLMKKHALPLDMQVSNLPADKKDAVIAEYKAIRRARIIKEDQYDHQHGEVQQVPKSQSGGSRTKNGKTMFKAFWTASNGNILSIVGAKVEVLNFATDDVVLATGYLELSGKYKDNLKSGGIFEFDAPTVDYKVRITPKYNGALVGGQVVGSYDPFEVVNNAGASYDAHFDSGKNATEYTAPASQDGDGGAARRSGAWGVYHAVLDVAKGAKDIHNMGKGSTFNAYFPIPEDDRAYYSPGTKNVYIGWNSRNDWDTLAHEYSHLIDDEYDIAESSPGGGHYINQNAYVATADRQKTNGNKDASLRLAMSEAYATWFGVHLTLLSPFKNLIDNVGDVKYKDWYSLEDNPSASYDTRGEDSELAVQRMMWDWADKANNESRTVSGITVRDRLSLGHAGLLNAMKNKSLKGIHELWEGKFLPGGDVSKFNQQTADAAESLVFFGLAPVLTAPAQNTELDLSETDPKVTFKWVEKDDTGHSDMDFDEYKLVLYNSDYSKVLFQWPAGAAWSALKEYELQKADLTVIETAMAGTLSDVKAVVFAKDTLSPVTGPYASNVIDLRTQGANRYVVMVVDSSGSNDWNDPNDLRKVAAKTTLNRLVSQAEAQAQKTVPDRAAAVDFDDYARVLSVLADPPLVEPTIDRVDSNGGTDIAAGIDAAVAILVNAQANGVWAYLKDKAAIMVFTDGENNAGWEPVAWSIAAANLKGIRVHVGYLHPLVKGGGGVEAGAVKGGGAHKGPPPYGSIEEAVLAGGGVYGEIADDVSQLAFVDQVFRAGLTASDPPDAGAIVGQVEIAGQLLDPLMDENYFFSGQQNENVTITVTGLDFDPEIYVVDRNGQFIASDKNYEGDRVAKIVTTLPYTGMYNVKIFSKGGGTGRFNIFVDAQNPGTGIVEDVTLHTSVTFGNWTSDPATGALVASLTLGNNTASPKTLKDAFWYVLPSSVNVRLERVDGMTPDGKPYLDITALVLAQLPKVGNGDMNLDPGESVTIQGVRLFSRDRSVPQGYVFALWADPPVGGAVKVNTFPLDRNTDFILDDFEMLEAVDQWNMNEIDDFVLLDAMEFWKASGYSWDSAKGKFVPNKRGN